MPRPHANASGDTPVHCLRVARVAWPMRHEKGKLTFLYADGTLSPAIVVRALLIFRTPVYSYNNQGL